MEQDIITIAKMPTQYNMTAFGVAVEVPGLTVTVYAQANEILEISGQLAFYVNDGGGYYGFGYSIWVQVDGVSYLYGTHWNNAGYSQTFCETQSLSCITAALAAGPHTVKVWIAQSGSASDSVLGSVMAYTTYGTSLIVQQHRGVYDF